MKLTGGKIEQEPYIGQNTLLDVCWRRERKDVWSRLQVYRWLHESHSIGCMLEDGVKDRYEGNYGQSRK